MNEEFMRDTFTRHSLSKLKFKTIESLSELLITENVDKAKLGLMIGRVAEITIDELINVSVFFDDEDMERVLLLYVLSKYVDAKEEE